MPPTDTYTTEELSHCSLWALASFSGPRHIYNGVRDRAMLLLAAATAFRGDSARKLQLSDLFRSEVPVDDLGLGTTVPVRVWFGLVLSYWKSKLTKPLRLSPCWWTMPNTTNMAVLMNTVHSATGYPTSVQSAAWQCYCLLISTCLALQCLNLSLTSPVPRQANTGAVSGMVTIVFGAAPLMCRVGHGYGKTRVVCRTGKIVCIHFLFDHVYFGESADLSLNG